MEATLQDTTKDSIKWPIKALITDLLDFPNKPLLPQSFEQHERHAIGQIQRTRLPVEHGNPQPPVTAGLKHFVGMPAVSRPKIR